MVSSDLPLKTTSHPVKCTLLTLWHLLSGIVLSFIPESWQQKDITGQTVLITGGGSGIGQLIAIRFAALGCKVVLWDVNEEGMKQTADKIKESTSDLKPLVFSYKLDLRSRESIYEAAKKVKQEVGPVDILINNAGVVTGKNLLELPDDKIEMTFQVNAMAHFWTVKAFLPDMVKRNSGHIVTVASVAGNLAGCAMADYHASKFANVGFDLALRMELHQANLDGIKTSIVKPYFISTGMFHGVNTLLPFLEPSYVADRVVRGIRANTHEIIIPSYFWHLFYLVALFPSRCLPHMSDLIGAFDFMTHFQGREGQQQVGDKKSK